MVSLALPVLSDQLSGKVLHYWTKAPIANVEVYIQELDRRVYTDKDGIFTSDITGKEQITLNLTAKGFIKKSVKINLLSGKEAQITICLEPSITYREEITVTGARRIKDAFTSPIPENIVDRSIIEQRKPQTIGELFKNEPGLYISSTGHGSVRPVIRGMYDSQILTLLNGIPLMDLRAGGNHVLLLQPEQMERVEVLRGPGSVLYGSDAIGGVINFITLTPNRFDSIDIETAASINTIYDSNGDFYTTEGGVSLGNRNIFLKSNFGYKRSENISDPNGAIPNSSYEGNYLDLAGGWMLEGYSLDIIYHQLTADVGIPTNPSIRYSKFEDEKQKSLIVSQDIKTPFDPIPSVKIKFAWQEHNRHFHLIQPFATDTSNYEQDMQIFVDVNAVNLQVMPVSIIGSGSILQFGIDYTGQFAESHRESYLTSLTDNSIKTLSPPRVIPDSDRQDIGIFIHNETTLGDITLDTGLRYDWVNSSSEATDMHPIPASDKSDGSWSGTLGVTYEFAKRANIYFNIGRAFRAPTLLERYFWGPHQVTVDKGNVDLKPETSLNLDLGLNYSRAKLTCGISLFSNTIYDHIYKERTGTIDKETGLEIDTWLNISEARLEGFETEFIYYLTDNIMFLFNSSYVYGTDIEADTPLTDIPPFNGNISVRYTDDIFSGELLTRFAAEQDRTGKNETSTDGYIVIDSSFGINLKDVIGWDMKLILNAKNLFNIDYKNHLSRVKEYYSEPGRSVSISISTSI
jgi:outer membrane receptor protein involved in Fe transport